MTETRFETKFFEVIEVKYKMQPKHICAMATKINDKLLSKKELYLIKNFINNDKKIVIKFFGEIDFFCQVDAHNFIIDKFDELESGSTIDVSFIKGETDKPVESEFNL